MRSATPIVLILFFLLGGCLAAMGQEISFPFDAPQELKDFFAAQTGKRGELALWKLVSDPSAPSGSKALLVVPNPRTNHGACFNVFLNRKIQAKDLEISVWLKPVRGREDQGGGPVWRAKDADNYYVVRWNPLEDNFRLYFVKRARRRMISSAKLKANPHRWHEIRVIHQGDLIRCYFDGKLKIKVRDRTFTQGGKIGLWTKADASTEFDQLRIKILTGDRKP